MNKVHVKVNDNVFVLSGKEAGKTGKVLKVDPKHNKVIVEGVNVVTKHKRPNMRLQTGGIIHQEAPLDASKLMFVCPKCKRPYKTGVKFLANGEKLRVCKACGETIESVRESKDTKDKK